MRLLIAGGGTGGHIYPALSVLEALPQGTLEAAGWMGRPDGLEQRIVAAHGLPYWPISAGAVRGADIVKLMRSGLALWRGYRQSAQVVHEFRPDVLMATGGYVTVAPVLAAARRGIPTLVYLPDMEPGYAVRALAPFVSRIVVSFPEAAAHFRRRRVVVSGYPVRRALFEVSREAALRSLGLEDGLAVLLVLGGSSGAHSINLAVATGLPRLLDAAQVIHIAGPTDEAQMQAVRDQMAAPRRARYRVAAYLHEKMTDALVAADLVVARAGAATLGEFPAAGLPAVLVPYPYAGAHQQRNAEYLARAGAAVVVGDDQLQERLVETVLEFMSDSERLRAMSQASRSIAAPQAAQRIAEELQILAQA